MYPTFPESSSPWYVLQGPKGPATFLYKTESLQSSVDRGVAGCRHGCQGSSLSILDQLGRGVPTSRHENRGARESLRQKAQDVAPDAWRFTPALRLDLSQISLCQPQESTLLLPPPEIHICPAGNMFTLIVNACAPRQPGRPTDRK